MSNENQEQVPDYIQEKLKRDFRTPEEMIAKPKGPARDTKPKRAPVNRVTVVEHVHHQVEGDDSTGIVAKYVRTLSTNLSSYVHKGGSIGEEWEKINTGFIKPVDVSVFIIINTTGTGLQVIPSQEEQEAIEKAVIQIGRHLVIPDKDVDVIVDVADILNKQHSHIDPSASADLYYIRCLCGTAKYKLFVIPK